MALSWSRMCVAGARARPRYRHVISLGYFCSTALELQRYGLRDASYPLDWNITPIQSALSMIQSGFDGFMEFDRLSQEPQRVLDTGSGIYLYNDFDTSRPMLQQYEAVRAKYARRIERFRHATRQPTLFVRYINSEVHPPGHVDSLMAPNLEEFTYLNEHMVDVLAILRQANPRNDLLLVGNTGLPKVCGGLPVYTVTPDDYDWVARKFLQKNPELSRKLMCLSYPVSLRAWNLLRYWWPLPRLRRRLALRTRLRRIRDRAFV